MEPAWRDPALMFEMDDRPKPDAKTLRKASFEFPARSDVASAAPEGWRALDGERIEPLQLLLHDLQTPVAVLELSLRMLRSDLGSAPPDALSTLADAQYAARRIRQYIDQLVRSEMHHEPSAASRRSVDLGPLLTELVDDCAGRAVRCGVSVTLDLDSESSLAVKGDDTLLQRVFQNLLDNSLSHIRGGKRVLVEARGGDVIVVRVCNDGPAIPDTDRDRIFQKYTRSAPEASSTGLGLYFCRLSVEAHGGTVSVSEDPEWPVCFVVRLPVNSG